MKIIAGVVFSFGLMAQAPFALMDRDTVVFYGDSITDQRLYTTFVETFVATRFPDRHVRFVHSGWGGDRVSGGGGGPIGLRLRRDVFAYKPTVMTIMLGMNDGRYRAWDAQIFKDYSEGYEAIIRAVRASFPSTRITVIEPSPYDDVTRQPGFEGGYNAVLVRYGTYLREMAARERLGLADLNTPVVTMLGKANAADAATAQKIIPDRVHPGAAGHLIMAAALLKAWNAPATVTRVEIDKGAIRRSENTAITGFNGLSWTQLDEALPMPVDSRDAVTALAVSSSDFVETLNQQVLKVNGLEPGTYTLKIDSEAVGDFTAGQLSGGINLATLATPMTKQAAEVHALTLKHNNVHFFRWRTLQTVLESDGFNTGPAEASLDALEEQIVAAQRAAAVPKPRRYELVKK